MILGLGIDIVELDRIKDSFERFGERFLVRFLTENERAAMPERHPVPFLAARFAAKEAASKALGTGFSLGVTMPSIEVVSDAQGKPGLVFHGAALERLRGMGGERTLISLTHGRDTAAAVVVVEGSAL